MIKSQYHIDSIFRGRVKFPTDGKKPIKGFKPVTHFYKWLIWWNSKADSTVWMGGRWNYFSTLYCAYFLI